MIERDGHIVIELEEAGEDVAQLVRLMQQKKQPVRVCSKGTPLAELSPIRRRRPLGSDRSLTATFLADPVRLTTEEDWPEELRGPVSPANPDNPG
ncbi:MAG TPA: hypothetical protein VG269_25910 [Tepidisphaeraceae bacterium]|nr:hypothetical protein [Tepidisphaeraceae bacterium]